MGWTPVVRRRRKKSARSESSGNLIVNYKISLVMYRKGDGIPRAYVHEHLKVSRLVSTKPSLLPRELELKIK